MITYFTFLTSSPATSFSFSEFSSFFQSFNDTNFSAPGFVSESQRWSWSFGQTTERFSISHNTGSIANSDATNYDEHHATYSEIQTPTGSTTWVTFQDSTSFANATTTIISTSFSSNSTVVTFASTTTTIYRTTTSTTYAEMVNTVTLGTSTFTYLGAGFLVLTSTVNNYPIFTTSNVNATVSRVQTTTQKFTVQRSFDLGGPGFNTISVAEERFYKDTNGNTSGNEMFWKPTVAGTLLSQITSAGVSTSKIEAVSVIVPRDPIPTIASYVSTVNDGTHLSTVLAPHTTYTITFESTAESQDNIQGFDIDSTLTGTSIQTFDHIPFPTTSSTTYTYVHWTVVDAPADFTIITTDTMSVAISTAHGGPFGTNIQFWYQVVLSTYVNTEFIVVTTSTLTDFPSPQYGTTILITTIYSTTTISGIDIPYNRTDELLPRLLSFTQKTSNTNGNFSSMSYSATGDSGNTVSWQTFIGIFDPYQGDPEDVRVISPVVTNGLRPASARSYTNPFYSDINWVVPSVTTPFWSFFTTQTGASTSDTTTSSSKVHTESVSTVAFSYFSVDQMDPRQFFPLFVWQVLSFSNTLSSTYTVSYSNNVATFHGGTSQTGVGLNLIESSTSYVSGNTLFVTRSAAAIFSSGGFIYIHDDRSGASPHSTTDTYTAQWNFNSPITDSTFFDFIVYGTDVSKIIAAGGYAWVSSIADYIDMFSNKKAWMMTIRDRSDTAASTETSTFHDDGIFTVDLTNIVGLSPATFWRARTDVENTIFTYVQLSKASLITERIVLDDPASA